MIGKTILHYKILEKLGEGGMGVVYKALDTKLNREVAIKFLPHHFAPSEEERQRFKVEAQAAAALNHPNIATIYAVEEVEGETFIVMEYIKGRELKDIIHSNLPKFLDLRKVLDYATQIADGLQAAHEEGVIHRDIKSANIMITEKDQVKIMDFGLAKIRGGDELTKEHSTLGTAAYMSPEQALGEKDIDHRTDIWSFGVVLYEMLTGQMPFKGDYDSAKIYSILNDKPDSIENKHDDVPTGIEQFILNCLEKKRDCRYQSFDCVFEDLKCIAIARDSGEGNLAIQPLHKNVGKVKTFAVVSMAAIFMVILAIIVLLIIPKRLKRPRIIGSGYLTKSASFVTFDPQLSPDGSRVAYSSDENGNFDVWIKQLASGQKINLTGDYNGVDGIMRWSPDGEWLAFVSARDGGGIFLISEYGGVIKKLVSLSYEKIRLICWSPDGKKLAYNLDGKLFIVPVEGGNPREIRLPHAVRFGPTWSSRSDRLVYTSYDQIWTVALDGSSPAPVVQKHGDYLGPPLWSHDGRRIYFKWKRGEVRDIWWIAVDENGKPYSEVQPLTSGLNIGSFSFSHNGMKLTYGTIEYQHNLSFIPITNDRIMSSDDVEQITFEKWYTHPQVNVMSMSPDYEWIALITESGGDYQVWIVQKTGESMRQITNDSTNKLGARWAPRGDRILYSGNGAIFSVSIKGGPATQLFSDSTFCAFPALSPDGKLIAFIKNQRGNRELWMALYNGGNAEQLTSNGTDNYDPIWSPDSSLISFGSDVSGAHDLYFLLVETKIAKRVTMFDSPSRIGHAWSPDGKKVYVNYQSEPNPFSRCIVEINVQNGFTRSLFECNNSTIQNSLQRAITTDGENIYFIKEYHAGNTWVADIVYE